MSQRYIQRYKRKWKRGISLSPQMNKRSRTKFSKFMSQQWWNNAKDWDWHSFWFQGWVWLECFSCVWVVVRQVQMSWQNWGEWKTIWTWSIWDHHIISHSCILHSNSVFVLISCSGNVGFFFSKKRVVSCTWYICIILCIYHTIKGVLITIWGCHIISSYLFLKKI